MQTIMLRGLTERFIDTIKKEKCAMIIGGDFNAELGPGEGVELSAVGHYTLDNVNARGEWKTQWLLENKLVAVNKCIRRNLRSR